MKDREVIFRVHDKIAKLRAWNISETEYIDSPIKIEIVTDEIEWSDAADTKNDKMITKIIQNPPATIVFFEDGSKEVVKCQNEDFDPEKGVAMAVCKHLLASKDYSKITSQKGGKKSEKLEVCIEALENIVNDKHKARLICCSPRLKTCDSETKCYQCGMLGAIDVLKEELKNEEN